MKYLLVIIIIIYSSFVSAKIIAEVGNCRITSIDLQQEIDVLNDKYEYPYGSIRQIALNNLIGNCLISNYATENRIYVDDTELEAFFIQQVGDLPRFQSNGVFSEEKFFYFKNSKEGRNVLKAMKKELRITKARTILEESFEISEAKLLRQYFMENTKIDLGYAILDKQDIDFEIETLPEDFEWYYLRNKHKYDKEERIKLNIFVVLKEEFNEVAVPIVNRKITQMILSDTTLSANETYEFRNEMISEKTLKLARQKAVQVTELLQANANISQDILESSYLSRNDELGNLPDIILNSAFELIEGQYSEPIQIDEGYLVYTVVDKKKIPIKDDQIVAKLIWQNYLKKEVNRINEDSHRNYFEENFEKFIIPAVIVTKIEISNPSLFSSTSREEYQQKIRHLLSTNAEDEYKLSKITEEYNLSESKENIYLEKFGNASIVDDMIAIRMNRGEEWGFIPASKKIIFYKALSYFPEFIPSFKKISDQLPQLIIQSKADSTNFRDYFDTHKKDFRTPDSLQIGGVVFSAIDEFNNFEFTIPDNEIRKIYNKRTNEFYREKSVKFNYIFSHNFNLAEAISKQAYEGVDASLLDLIFGCNYTLPKNKIVTYDDLPEQISSALSNMDSGMWSQPISYDNGWIVLNKIENYNAGTIPFSEMKYELRKEALMSIADTIASKKAQVIFDSTRYFSHVMKFAEENEIFKTEFQNAKEDFYILGDISTYRSELLRMWKNEKYSGIIKLENAYAVIFQTDIRRSRQLTYDEVLPQIVEIQNSAKKFEIAKANVSEIRNKIATGANPDSLLYYLGGWNVISALSLTSKIPGVDFSEAIYDDILKHEEGYCSSIIPINSEKLLFYKLLKLNKPSKNDFYSDRLYYEKIFLKKEFDKWKNEYKVKIGVKIN
ncbi:MAG: peptidyl-prolyl cis-trans isomerase [Candidatus Tenebribacter mawsonii]|nr:peptidyl-prolyl cis-trans isomerase [Candidatus Tenebribacter mawsonii]